MNQKTLELLDMMEDLSNLEESVIQDGDLI